MRPTTVGLNESACVKPTVMTLVENSRLQQLFVQLYIAQHSILLLPLFLLGSFANGEIATPVYVNEPVLLCDGSFEDAFLYRENHDIDDSDQDNYHLTNIEISDPQHVCKHRNVEANAEGEHNVEKTVIPQFLELFLAVLLSLGQQLLVVVRSDRHRVNFGRPT